VPLRHEPEGLISNWLRVTELPDHVRYLEISGAMDHGLFQAGVNTSRYPLVKHNRGIITFLDLAEVNEELCSVGRFVEKASCSTLEFLKLGMPEIGVAPREASAHLVAMFGAAWERYAVECGLVR
jgi:hypothetical protein